MKLGMVYLVGGGPGPADLMTLRAVACLSRADVVIYDYLASDLLAYAPKSAEKVYVGKKEGKHTVSQEKINELLVEKAGQGLVVARLKGGDPFIFGRGGEEAEVLADAGIPFEVVPGVTAGVAAPACAGIPLTHRNYNTSVAFVTGHEDPTKLYSTIEWSKLATGVGTIVIFMGIKNLPRIVERLIAGGRSSETPVAVVRWGATTKQQTVVGTLNTIVARMEDAGICPPAVVIVGETVRLRDKLNWFEKRPLFGKTVAVTRAQAQASDLVSRLSALGAECLECPTIEIVPPSDWTRVDAAIEKLESYDWIVFTSVNGVSFFFDRLFALGKDVRALRNAKTACIGPATADRLMSVGFRTDLVPETYRAEAVIEAFAKEQMAGKRVLLPRAKEARAILPVEVRKMGATLDEIAVYQTNSRPDSAKALLEHLRARQVDVVTFTSSSTVKNFMEMLPASDINSLIEGLTIASIGPITSDTARKLGLPVHVEATNFTIPGLCDAIVSFFR